MIAVLDQRLNTIKRFETPGGSYKDRPDSGINALTLTDLEQDGRRELLAKVGSGYAGCQRRRESGGKMAV